MARRAKPTKLPSGKYRLQTSVDGQRISITRRTMRECYGEYDRIKSLEAAGLRSDGLRLTVADYMQSWSASRKRSVRDTTWARDDVEIRLRIIPGLGDMRLLDISPDDVDAWLSDMQEAGESAHSQEKAYEVLSKAMSDAEAAGKIGKNPCSGIAKPKRPHVEKRALDTEQTRALLAAGRGHRLEALFYLYAIYGQGEMEALGLGWSDIDWVTGYVNIHRQLKRTWNRGEVWGPVKNRWGRRRYQLGSEALRLLSERYTAQAEERAAAGANWRDLGLIFTTFIGTPLNYHNVLDREYRPLLKRASGVPDDLTIHELRHTAASAMLRNGMAVSKVAVILGHDPAVLMRTYAHLIPDDYDLAAQMIEEPTRVIEVEWSEK
ncbi:MAG TPA: tyrosine-type recombinase/integrase [Bellilinea sp.]|nr:tyrosine-type recombinase/integrase [Bellilinea sp.]